MNYSAKQSCLESLFGWEEFFWWFWASEGSNIWFIKGTFHLLWPGIKRSTILRLEFSALLYSNGLKLKGLGIQGSIHTLIVFPSPTLHRMPFCSSRKPWTRLFHRKEASNFVRPLNWTKIEQEKYQALNMKTNKVGSVIIFHEFFARKSRLTEWRSLNPIPPSFLGCRVCSN